MKNPILENWKMEGQMRKKFDTHRTPHAGSTTAISTKRFQFQFHADTNFNSIPISISIPCRFQFRADSNSVPIPIFNDCSTSKSHEIVSLVTPSTSKGQPLSLTDSADSCPTEEPPGPQDRFRSAGTPCCSAQRSTQLTAVCRCPYLVLEL